MSTKFSTGTLIESTWLNQVDDLVLAGPGGGETEVVHTLSTMPGYGIVPEETVADYTALDAFIAAFGGITPPGTATWVEVTTGPETLTTEIWRVVFNGAGADTYGPFGSWVKNAKYVLGQNGENHLIVQVEVPGFTPVDSGSSKFINAPDSNGEFGDWYDQNADNRRQQNRFGSCVPVFADKLTFPTTSSIRVTNNRESRTTFVLVNDVFGEGATTNKINFITGADLIGSVALNGNMEGSAEFYLHEGEVWLDAEKTTNVAGIPWTYASASSIDNSQKYAQRVQDAVGVIHWDHQPDKVGIGYAEGAGIYRLSFSDEYQASRITIGAATTLRLQSINPNFGSYLLYLTNGGAFAITWPVGTKFPGGSQPAWTAAGTDLAQLVWDSNNWTVVRLAANIS